MRRTVLALALVIIAAACVGKKAAPAPGEAVKSGDAAPPVASGAVAGLLAKLKVPAAPADAKPEQSSPEKALNSFFEALNIAQDPTYQAAARTPDQEPEKTKKYQEARAHLRALFVSADAYTEITAYLDLIKMKRAAVSEKAKIEGDKATLKVHIFKGDNLEIDPMSFGESSKTEADALVKLVRQGGDWRIEDFGGLLVQARARRG